MRVSKLQAASLGLIAAAFVAALAYERARDGAQAAEIAALRGQLAGDARLRSENDSLRRKAAEGAAAAEAARMARAGAPAQEPGRRTPGGSRQSVPLAAGLTPVLSAGNQGRATPRAALATQFWAARTGDVALEARSIALSPESRARLGDLAAALPDALRQEYGTPELLMAYMLVGSPHPVGGFEVTGGTGADAGEVTLETQWQHADDDVVHQSAVSLRLGRDGWQVVIPPPLVERAARYLQSTLPGAR
ncbi:MAG TPA: hypothetical protein VGG34_11155 [Opitutaceae bacterium]|jgi:hypothetical protein